MYTWLASWPPAGLCSKNTISEAFSDHHTENFTPALSLPFLLNFFLLSCSITQHIWQTIHFNFLLVYCLFLQSSTNDGIFFFFFFIQGWILIAKKSVWHIQGSQKFFSAQWMNKWMEWRSQLLGARMRGCVGIIDFGERRFIHVKVQYCTSTSAMASARNVLIEKVFPVPPRRPGKTSAYFLTTIDGNYSYLRVRLHFF